MSDMEPGNTIDFKGVRLLVLTKPEHGRVKALQDLPNGRSVVIAIDLPADRTRASSIG
jgi:hypothetical protein